MSEDLGLDGTSIAFVFGVDMSRYVASAQSDDLAGGETEDGAARTQKIANSFPVVYSLKYLYFVAGGEAQLAFQKFPNIMQVSNRLIIRTGPEGGPLQEHLAESFTCMRADAANCVSGSFYKIPGFSISPWYAEHAHDEIAHFAWPPVTRSNPSSEAK